MCIKIFTYSCDGKAKLSAAFTLVLSVMWFFRNHSNMPIWCTSSISRHVKKQILNRSINYFHTFQQQCDLVQIKYSLEGSKNVGSSNKIHPSKNIIMSQFLWKTLRVKAEQNFFHSLVSYGFNTVWLWTIKVSWLNSTHVKLLSFAY